MCVRALLCVLVLVPVLVPMVVLVCALEGDTRYRKQVNQVEQRRGARKGRGSSKRNERADLHH